MEIRKIFFPIGGGDSFEGRIYGALLVGKFFKSHIKFLASQIDFDLVYNMQMSLTFKSRNVFDVFKETFASQLDEEKNKNYEIFQSLCKKADVKISKTPIVNEATADFVTKQGVRSKVVEYESKFCDFIITATPPHGENTGTFGAVLKSGKNAIIIPRELKKFSADNILVGWNGTTSISRALTQSIFLLKMAKNVHIITTYKYANDKLKDDLLEYLSIHGVNANFEIINTTSIPGEALLCAAQDGYFDLVVASGYGENGLQEMHLGGTTKYFLQHSPIPVFVS